MVSSTPRNLVTRLVTMTLVLAAVLLPWQGWAGGTVNPIEPRPVFAGSAPMATPAPTATPTPQYHYYWPEYQYNPAHQSNNPYEHILNNQNVKNLVVVHSFPTQNTTAVKVVRSSPVIVENNLFIGSSDTGNIFAFNTQTGQNSWSAPVFPSTAPTTTQHVEASAVVDNGRAFIASEAGSVFGFDMIRGTLVWTNTLPAEDFYGSPIAAFGSIYIGSLTGKVYSFNESKSNTINWTTVVTGAIYGSPAYFAGKIYVGTDRGFFYILDANTGNILATSIASQAPYRGSPAVISGTIASNGVVVYAGTDFGAVALDGGNGNLLGKVNIPTVPTGTVANNGVWSTPAIADGNVYIGSNTGYLYAYSLQGNPLTTQAWKQPAFLQEAIVSSPAVVNGVVYVGSRDFNLYVLDAATGDILNTFGTNGPVDSSPAIAAGNIFFGSADGHVYQLAAAPPPTATPTDTPTETPVPTVAPTSTPLPPGSASPTPKPSQVPGTGAHQDDNGFWWLLFGSALLVLSGYATRRMSMHRRQRPSR